MSRISRWIGSSKLGAYIGDKARPASVGVIIDDKPTNIVITRVNQSNGQLTTLPAQRVRIDMVRMPADIDLGDTVSAGGAQFVLVLGYKNHPTEPNTDIKIGDTFPYDNALHRVVMVEVGFTDRVLAIAEAYGRT
jgi:hypothetical protein